MLLFAEVRISVTTTYGYEDVHGFPYPEKYLEIGSAMLSVVIGSLLLTNHLSDHVSRSRRDPVSVVYIFWNNNNYILIIISFFIQHHSRATTYDPVATADERLKQRLREVSLCARAGGATVMSWRSFFLDTIL